MNLTFILVEPAVPENVGAAARALKTMGFERLVLVNSRVHLQPEARWLAHGAADIIDRIVVFGTLAEAVEKADLVIGTTAKKRRVYADHYSCFLIGGLLESKSPELENVALVFGREESGLTNEELKLCNLSSGIPMKGSYPSLNLAQSVMIYAWELSPYNQKMSGTGDHDTGRPKAGRLVRETPSTLKKPDAKGLTGGKYSHLRTKVSAMLCRIGYDPGSAVYSRIMERLEAVGDKDAGLLLSVCSRLEKMLAGNSGRE